MTIRARTCTGTNIWAKNKVVLKRSVSLRCYTGPKIHKVPPPKWYTSSGWVTIYPKDKRFIGGSDSVDVEIIELKKERWIFADSDEETEEEEENRPVTEDNKENRPVTEEEKENRPVNI